MTSVRPSFRIAPDGSPIEAIEELFGVKVTDVWTSNQRGKVKRMGRTAGRRPNWKKAIVTLREGRIEIFEG